MLLTPRIRLSQIGAIRIVGKASTISAQLAAIAVRGAIPTIRYIERPDIRSTAQIIPFPRRRV